MHHPPRPGPERHQLHAPDPQPTRRGGGTRQRHGDDQGPRTSRRTRPTRSCARCAPRSAYSGRFWAANGRPPSRCPAAASSATGPIDLHLKGFESLGAKVRMAGGDVKVFASELHGAVINLRGKHGSTVLGTDNVMMAAVLAEGDDRHRGSRRRAGGRRSGEFPQRHGREDRGRGHPAHHRRGREGTPRRGTRGHSRPHRGRDVPRRRSDLRQRRHVEKRHPRAPGLRDRTPHRRRVPHREHGQDRHRPAPTAARSRSNW